MRVPVQHYLQVSFNITTNKLTNVCSRVPATCKFRVGLVQSIIFAIDFRVVTEPKMSIIDIYFSHICNSNITPISSIHLCRHIQAFETMRSILMPIEIMNGYKTLLLSHFVRPHWTNHYVVNIFLIELPTDYIVFPQWESVFHF